MTQTKKNILVLLFIVVAAAALLASIYFSDGTNSQTAENEVLNDRTRAAQFCAELVRKRVKTPSTLKFVSPLMGDYYEEFRPPKFPHNTRIVGMEFDAQNRLGATVRYDSECNFKVTGEDWSVNYVNIVEH
jgi:hypothetical protein